MGMGHVQDSRIVAGASTLERPLGGNEAMVESLTGALPYIRGTEQQIFAFADESVPGKVFRKTADE